MIVAHGTWIPSSGGGGFFLWGETGSPAPPRGRTKAGAAPLHPFHSPRPQIEEEIFGAFGENGYDASFSRAESDFLLPSLRSAARTIHGNSASVAFADRIRRHDRAAAFAVSLAFYLPPIRGSLESSGSSIGRFNSRRSRANVTREVFIAANSGLGFGQSNRSWTV